MNLLAIDTSTHQAAVAVATAPGEVYVAAPDPAERHGRNLLPAIAAVLRQAGLTIRDLDAFAVGLGPGSYTGLRIGVTAAKTLAYAAGKPLVGVGSLDVIARNAPADALRVAVIADAQRGDVYVAEFARSAPSMALVAAEPTRVVAWDRWSEAIREPTLVLGPGLERRHGTLPAAAVTLCGDVNQPDGRQLVALAYEAFATGRRDDPRLIEPLYLRRSAAEDQWDALGRHPSPAAEDAQPKT